VKIWIVTGVVLAGLAVGLGAFGAHGLKSRLSPDLLMTFETAVKYHFFHALGLIIVGILGFHFNADVLYVPAWLFVSGIVLFSGSLYWMSISGQTWVGIITPFGGVAFILGWLLLGLKIWKAN